MLPLDAVVGIETDLSAFHKTNPDYVFLEEADYRLCFPYSVGLLTKLFYGVHWMSQKVLDNIPSPTKE